MNKVKVMISNKQAEVKVPSGIRLLIRRCVTAALAEEKFDKPAEVSVSFVNNNEIQALNSFYRKKDMPTDVLSFPLGENGVYDVNPETGAYMLGDIVISLQKAVYQAEIYGHTLQREVGFLTVHSMFHLLGYDHEQGGLEARIMREKEERVLTELGIARGNSFVIEHEEKN